MERARIGMERTLGSWNCSGRERLEIEAARCRAAVMHAQNATANHQGADPHPGGATGNGTARAVTKGLKLSSLKSVNPNRPQRAQPMTTNSDPLVRLELLISHIADLVWPSRDLVNALRLRANTSSIERGHLDYLIDTTDALSDQLDAFGDEVRELRRSVPDEIPRF